MTDKIAITNGDKTRWVAKGSSLPAGYHPVEVAVKMRPTKVISGAPVQEPTEEVKPTTEE